RDEQEASLGLLLDRPQARRGGADQDRRDLRLELDLERLRARSARGQRLQAPLGVDRGRGLGEDDAVAAADGALAREDLTRPVRYVLARHLDEPERRDLDDVRLGAVALQLGLQRLLDGRPVLRVRHVDEVDDDDPADVAKPELAHDLLDGLEVVLRNRVLESTGGRLAARAHETAGVDVDHGECLGVVEDEVAARRQVDAARERGADLGVDAGALHQRGLLAVPDDAVGHVRRGLLQVADDTLVGALVVDERTLEVIGEEVADHPEGELGLLVDERRRLGRLRLRLDLLPEPLQEDEVALDVLGGRALGGSADDHAALLHVELLQDVAQARALLVLEPARDAQALAVRDEDDEAARERDLGRQARALRLHRVLDGLDEHLLAAAEQVLDLAAARLALELGRDHLVDVEEAVLLEADLDERSLHARQDVVDDALVDVPCDRPALGSLAVGLGDLVVLEYGDALLADVDRDEQLALRGRERRAAGSRAAPRCALLAALRGTALRARLVLLLRLRLLRRCLR